LLPFKASFGLQQQLYVGLFESFLRVAKLLLSVAFVSFLWVAATTEADACPWQAKEQKL